MEEVIEYLVNKIKDLVEENVDLITTTAYHHKQLSDIKRYKEMIRYIYGELNAFEHSVSEEAKIGLIKYIEETMEGGEN